MDSMRTIFSRGPSPPRRASFDNPQQLVDTQPASVDPISSSPNHIETLFNNLGSPTSTQSHTGPFMNPHSVHESNSAPATPGIGGGGPGSTASSTVSAPVNTSSERQNALLSLLGSVSVSNTAANTPSSAPVPQLPQQVQQQQQPQQIPTPPGSASAQRSPPINNNDQGKFLLDQLMSG